jgi:exonuclease SbcC
MRPITLDMHGFASFREEAHVDFSDAEFFALVGPTGSGKSTVVDAMTFALYGSVPRWGRKGMVSMALAPSVARGTVKLVFEVAGQRYVVARELRRIGGTVSQRAASLERLADPAGLAAPGDQTFPMAKDLDGVNDAVQALLGLKYEDFVQCVVLPQGQFAAFLHAKPSERQDIVLRLLGAEHYRLMMMKANQRASVAAQRAGTYSEELLGYADATPEAEAAARAAEGALVSLGERVTAALPLIAAGRDARAAAEDRLGQLRAEAAALAALRVPDGVGQLDADLAAARSGRAVVLAGERLAEAADESARNELARGPRRAPLELARAQRAEHARLQASVPGLAGDVARHGERAADASAAVDDAAAVLEAARTDRDEASREAETARALVAALAAEHARLASVSVPARAAELDKRRAAAAGAVTAAAASLEEAEQADAAARAALAAAVPEAPLAQASRDLGDLRTVLPEVARAGQAAGQAAAARQAADEAQAGAEQRRRAAAADVEETRRAHVVAGLRPHLVAGEPCPVCEQTVTALPAPVPAREVDAAETRLAQADRAVRAAQSAARDAVAAAGTADAHLAAGLRRQTVLAGGLAALLSGPLAGFGLAAAQSAVAAIAAGRDSAAGRDGAAVDGAAGRDGAAGDGAAGDSPTECDGRDRPHAGAGAADLLASAAAEVAGLAASRRAAEQAAELAAAAAQRARAAHRAAQAQAAATDAELTTAQAALRSARDPLVELGAPPVDGTGLAAGWAALARWAEEQASARSAALDQARDAEKTAAGRRDKLAAEFGAAEQALARLRAAAKDASRADAGARAALSQVTASVAQLGAELADAPGDEQITAGLALLGELEAAAVAAGDALRAARGQRAAREAELAALEGTERTARAQLSAARDRVVALGAPAVGDRGLIDGWTHLVTWASGAVKVREQQAETAAREADAARARTDELTGRLSADLAEAGIDLGREAAAAGAGSAVTGALADARAATRRIAERRSAAAGLAARQRTAQEEQQVAHLLGNLLQARQFPQWLVSEALDELVAAASQTLEALSGGQFNLTHDKGDLFVIDRTDADARRSVRTLSGGETFQASLALALALSSHISALAAAGAARLDAIFLDEGFGTLDPETLEVVAATLEALAEGDRMVGVVTHVAALAERVPVRFRVARNAVTSTVTREGLPTGTDEG